MTYYEEETLSTRLKEAPLPAVGLFRIGIAAAQGLKCAHDNGTVRCMSPEQGAGEGVQ
jgi:hypothetical protein